MKKFAVFVILFVLAAVAWQLFFSWNGMTVDIDGEEIGGPLGAFLGMLFAGGGVLVAGLVLVVAGAVLAVVVAGLGVIVLGAMGVAAFAVAAAVSPLLLPLLLPLALIWFFASRSKKRRMAREQPV